MQQESDGRLDVLTRIVLASAALAILFIAFEVRTPVFSLGPLVFTTSEITAGLFIAASLAYAAANRSWYFPRRALDIPVLLFLLVNFLSTAVAAEDKPGALKFSLRMMYAALVYLAVSRLPARSRAHLWIAGAVTATLAIETVIGLLENYVGAIEWPNVLEPFNEGVITFGTFYNIRVAATFPFPTVLSMFLELALPMGLAVGLWWMGRVESRGRKRLVIAATVALLAGVTVVQVFTYTRTALVAMPVALLTGAVLAAAFGYGRRVWIFMLVSVAILLVTVGGLTLFSNKMAARLDVAEQERYYGTEFTILEMPTNMKLNSLNTIRIHVKNTGSLIWTPDENEGVFLGYRWLRYPDREEYPIEHIITLPSETVYPGGETDFTQEFWTPSENGKYALFIDLAKTHVNWFSTAGPPPLIVPLEFVDGNSRPLAITETAADFVAGEPPAVTPPRSQLWRAALKTWKANPILGLGPDQFRKVYFDYMPELPRDDKVRTHNILLEAAANTGIIGLAVIVFLLIRTLQVQFRLVRARDRGDAFRLASLALLVASVAYLFHGALDYFLWSNGIAFLFFAYLGLTSWLDWSRRQAG